jgi:hypothetical protein
MTWMKLPPLIGLPFPMLFDAIATDQKFKVDK